MNYSGVILYPMPEFLKGKCNTTDYSKWLIKKAQSLLIRDKKRNKPYAKEMRIPDYCRLIHNAVIAGESCDPYTGEEMRWDLIRTWDPAKAHSGGGAYEKQFALLPTADHIDPSSDKLVFEICSWRSNTCKSNLTPAEFISYCSKVASHCQSNKNKRLKRIKY